MFLMDMQSIKIDLIQWLTELQDKDVLQKLQSFKKEQEEIDLLSDDQKTELERRLKAYEKGEMTFSSWEEAKARIRSEAPDGL